MFPVASRVTSLALPINDDDMLKIVFKFVVIAKIHVVYASTVMHGAVLRTRRIDRLETFVRRCVRRKLYQQDDPTVS